jgi:asparagine synthase (glutamine-hydrolysing)
MLSSTLYSRVSARCFSTLTKLRCGLVATLSASPNAVPQNSIDKALHVIKHRGPDHVSKWSSANEKVNLGHTRLSIIDITGGHQPITNQAGDVAVIVNGELYDFERIRQELQAKGYTFKTQSDSEILLHLYEEYRLDMFKHLRGEFAFVIFDERHQTLIFGRDRFGIKPLFYTHNNAGVLCLASEMKALFQLGVECVWEESVITSMHSVINAPIFKGITQVPPGHYVVVNTSNPRSLRTIKYWDIDYETINNDHITEEEAKTNVRKLLEDAMRYRLRSDVPVGVYLSGGIDSCAILGLANTILKRDYGSNGTVDAFTIAFEEHKEFDEGDIAQRFAQKYGAKFHKIPLRQKEMVDYFEKATYHGEGFNINLNYVAKYALAKAVNEHGYKVMLSGEGSDEFFLGYPTFKVNMLKNALKTMDPTQSAKILERLIETNIAWRALMNQPDSNDQKNFEKFLGYKSSVFAIPMLSALDAFVSDEYKHAQQLDVVQFMNARVLTPDVVDKMKNKWHPVYNDAYLWSKSIFVSLILQSLGDRVELASSVEVRTPFLDHHVVEYVNNLPIHMKLKIDPQNGTMTEKYILREATKDLLNEELYKRVKHPFFAPPVTWKQDGPMYEYIQQTLRSHEFTNQPFIDQKKVVGVLDQLHMLPKDKSQQIESILLYLCQLNVLNKMFKPSVK